MVCVKKNGSRPHSPDKKGVAISRGSMFINMNRNRQQELQTIEDATLYFGKRKKETSKRFQSFPFQPSSSKSSLRTLPNFAKAIIFALHKGTSALCHRYGPNSNMKSQHKPSQKQCRDKSKQNLPNLRSRDWICLIKVGYRFPQRGVSDFGCGSLTSEDFKSSKRNLNGRRLSHVISHENRRDLP